MAGARRRAPARHSPARTVAAALPSPPRARAARTGRRAVRRVVSDRALPAVHGLRHGERQVPIPPGDSARQIGDLLARMASSPRGSSSICARSLDGDGSKLRHGIVRLRRGMSYSAALDRADAAAPRRHDDQGHDPRGLHAPPDRRARHGRRPSGDYLVASRPSSGFDPRTLRCAGVGAHARGLPLPGDLLQLTGTRA